MGSEIIGAYHVATFPGWERVVVAQCTRLRNSGLLDLTCHIVVGVVGEREPAVSTIERLLDGKARVTYCGDITAFEFPTLQLLYEAAAKTDSFSWYIHTKGISSQSLGAENHRLCMESVVIDNHELCYDTLRNYDACGPGWRTDGFDRTNPHFAGNFWWARTSYLRTLVSPNSLDLGDRYQAEFWIGKSDRIRPFCLELSDVPITLSSDPFAKPSAWVGLEHYYQQLCEIEDPLAIKRVVDIGVDYGFSTFHFAKDFPAADIVGVSDFRLHLDSEMWVRRHLEQFSNVRLLVGDSPTVGAAFSEPIDILHLDGDHSYEGVKKDFEAWVNCLKPNGRVIFHDTQSFDSVRQFFNELPGRKKEIHEHHGLGCWFKQG
ncbi:MAG: hypothetical protein JWP89_267 [Schlesneria sp.]|nr:hypothetical protein [Schlesneria sp.]